MTYDWLHVVLSFVIVFVCLSTQAMKNRWQGNAYFDGFEDGSARSTSDAEVEAVENYKASLERKMADAGRKTAVRPGTEPVVIHKAQVGSAPRKKPGKDMA